MNTFTKLSVNGVEKFVSAVYDGSGNIIVDTYETISNVSAKETALSDRITEATTAHNALVERVVATEAFDARITKNTSDISSNAEAIAALQGVDTAYRTELDNLTIKTGANAEAIEAVDGDVSSLSKTVNRVSNQVSDLEAIVKDEAQGINALNTQADANTAALHIGRR